VAAADPRSYDAAVPEDERIEVRVLVGPMTPIEEFDPQPFVTPAEEDVVEFVSPRRPRPDAPRPSTRGGLTMEVRFRGPVPPDNPLFSLGPLVRL
jgi:hypothetical protein